MAKAAERQTLLTCLVIQSPLSNITPRLRTSDLGVTGDDLMLTVWGDSVGTKREAKNITSVLLSLNFSLFDVDHTLMSFRQVTSFCMALWKITYNCVSSAYITHLSPCCVMMSCKGALYMVNKIGPITDPCGTPKRRARSSERVPLMLTVWMRPFKYEVNHARAEEVIPYLVVRRCSKIPWSMCRTLRRSLRAQVQLHDVDQLPAEDHWWL